MDGSDNRVLNVEKINVKIKDKTILRDISLETRSGELLAIIGPTGCGKSTLLNVITGRLKANSGRITLNGQEVNKRSRRQFGFVLQNDVFFSNLTLWQTLYFTAELRLPQHMTRKEKIAKIQEIISAMELSQCQQTVIGDMFTRGLSGGEKKRASIACELLTDPSILVLDVRGEPTSGLDSSTALSIMRYLKQQSGRQNGRIVISSIHQPSSQIYGLFDRLLMMVDGQTAYSGMASQTEAYFLEIGHVCEDHYNPADFLLELAKSKAEEKAKILDHAAKTYSRRPILAGAAENTSTGVIHTAAYSDQCYTNKSFGSIEDGWPVSIDSSTDANTATRSEPAKWQTSFCHQCWILGWRGFIQARGRLVTRFTLAELLVLSVLIGLVYFQINVTYDRHRDVMGLLFFTLGYWAFQAAAGAILSFPEERSVVAKERSSGAYRLSAYYVSKSLSDLPVLVALATVMFTAFFWMAGLGPVEVFFKTYGILLLFILASQGLGYLLGALIKDTRVAMTFFQSYLVSSYVIGGFFIQKFPEWLRWLRYLAWFTYPFSCMSTIVMEQLEPISCNTTFIQACADNVTTVSGRDILEEAGIILPLYAYLLPLVALIIILRLLAYIAMRHRQDFIY